MNETAPPALILTGLDALRSIIAQATAPPAASLSSSPPTSVAATPALPTRAVKQFSDCCDKRGLELVEIKPLSVAAYIDQLGAEASKPTVKQHLAAIREAV